MPRQRNIFLLNKGMQNVNPRELGEEWCAPDFHMGPSYRPFYLVHYIFSGSGTFQIGKDVYKATKGQLAILRPFDVMNYATDADDPWHYCWLGFECTLDIPVLRTEAVVDLPQAEHLFQAMKDADTIQYDREYFVCGKIYELITQLQQLAAPVRNQTVDYIFKIRHYLDTNFERPITMEQLAQTVNLNRSYMSTAFRKYVGCSPQQYLIDVRLEHAAALLVNEGCSVNAAALSCGYTDVYNFSKMFRKKYGMSPTEYRQRQQTDK